MKEKNLLKKNRKSFHSLLKESMILITLNRLSNFIYKSIAVSMFGRLFTSYDDECSSVANSRILGKSYSHKYTKFIKRHISQSFEQSAIIEFLMKHLNNLLLCSMKVYGMFTMSFGLYTAIIYLIEKYAFWHQNTDISNLIFGLTAMFLSIPMFMSKKSLSTAICDSYIVSFLLFSVIGIRREWIEKQSPVGGRNNIAFIIGMLFGLFTFFIYPVMIIIAIFAFIGAYILLLLPEFGVVLLVFSVPFLPTMILVGLTIYTCFCYLLKLIRGKRTVKFEIIDGVIFIFLVLMLFGGIFSVSIKDSAPSAIVFVCFMLGYFLVVNLLKSSEWVNRCIAGLITSSFIVSIYGLYQNFFGAANTTWQDKDMFTEIEGRVVSTFENPNVLAEYLIMTIPFIIALFIITKKASAKILTLMLCGVGVGCLIYTWSRGAWLGFIIGIILFMLVYSKKTLIAMLFGLITLPFIPFILPESILNRFMSIGNVRDSSTSYRVSIWEASIRMIKDFFESGIGVGTGAFGLVYPQYSLAGIETAPHSHNLYLQIVIEIGIIGLIIFLAAMIIFAQSNFAFFNSDAKKSSHLLVAAGFSGIVAILAQGMTDYIWYNYRVFFMFWLIIGLTMAVKRSTIFEDTNKTIIDSI